MTAPASHLEQIASRAATLYSRPTVAMELVRLADEPGTGPLAIKQCLSQDPALACKVLRVVNSSLYGLNRPVADLNQAIGLLGIKPLKLLVLGFSLPDGLLSEVAARELRWYWTHTLTRSVSARLIAEAFWPHSANDVGSGDEAMVAGLLQDVGVLVLLRELGEPYARFLAGVIDERCDLAALEKETLGFHHGELSAALLARWQLPRRLVEAIAAPKRTARLARLDPPEGDLPQILHLAELLAQLVGQHRLSALGELLEAARVYRGITKPQLAELVKGLQPQVDQLAEVLALELAGERDYEQVLLEAHRQMAALSEQVLMEAPPPTAAANGASVHLRNNAQELVATMQRIVDQPPTRIEHSASSVSDDAAPDGIAHVEFSFSAPLVRKLSAAATRCRERRQELSLLLVAPKVESAHSAAREESARDNVRYVVENVCATLDPLNVALLPLPDGWTAAIVANCDRRAALTLAHGTIAELARQRPASNGEPAPTVSIGLATASVVPANFDPLRMIDRATSCLRAARATGISAVKSIEV